MKKLTDDIVLEEQGAAFGATLLVDGTTVFRLWAPGVADANLLIYPDKGQEQCHAMNARDQGWFALRLACGPGTRYRFHVGGRCVPDPASRLQDGDVHDASVVTDPNSYRWRTNTWRGRPWREAVLYELHVGAFGGYEGVRAHLPRLAELGITAVELMPIADFPGKRNWGYDGVLPYAPDCAYGTPDQLKALIDEAHALGLMMFLDVVYNHFGPDGNYLHCYAPQFFRDDIGTPWGPALDFRRPEVRRFFTDNALTWLQEYRFDGLRLDAAHAIADQDWLDELAHAVRQQLGPQRQVHLVLEHEGNRVGHLAHGGFDAQWNDDGHHILHVLITGEKEGYYADYAEHAAERLARCLEQGFIYQGEPSAYRDGAPRGSSSGHLAPDCFVLFLQNHDQVGNRAMGERLLTLARKKKRLGALRAALALLLLSPQIPLIFMGEEVGSETPFLYFISHAEALAKAVSDGRRQEFSRFPAFAGDAAQAAIPDPNAVATFEASIPAWPAGADSAGWSDYYRKLLDLRRQVWWPCGADVHSAGAVAIGRQAVAARWYLDKKRVLALYVNFSTEVLDLDPPSAESILFESERGAGGELMRGRLQGLCTVACLEDAPS